MSIFNAASFLIAEGCNLRCPYCFEENKKQGHFMSDEVIRKSLVLLMEESKSLPINTPITVILFGGEPTLNPDRLESFLNICSEVKIKYGRPISLELTTNATIMNKKLKKLLKKAINLYNLSVQMSIDGIPDVQDEQRPSASFPSSILVESVVPIYKELFKHYPTRLTVHACITPKSVYHTYESYKYFNDELNIPIMWFLPIYTPDWTDDSINEYEKQMRMILDDITNNPETAINNIDKIAPFNNALKNKTGYEPLCGAGFNFISITADGIIYPCHHYYYTDPNGTIIGNVNDGIDHDKAKIFEEAVVNNHCDHCSHNTCYVCSALNYEVTGSMWNRPSDNYCKLMLIDKKFQDEIRSNIIRSNINRNYYQDLKFLVD